MNPSPPWPTAQFGLRSLMACCFTNQVPAQLDGLRLWSETTAYKNDVYLFLEKLDEEVARLHFPAFDTELNVFTQEQIIQVSRLKAFTRVRTTVSMAACGPPVCEKHRTLYRRDRPGWLRRLGKLMLCSFPNQVLAQPELLEGKHGLQKRSSPLARELNEIAAHLHLLALGAELTVFTQECCLYAVELPLICLRRTRNPTPISALRANMSFVHCCLCPAVLTNCSQGGCWMSPVTTVIVL